MSNFFRKETKNRIMAGLTAGAVLTSSLVGMAPKAFAEETTPATTVTAPVTPEAPAPAEESQPAPAETETPAVPVATTEETTPAAAPTTEENSTVTAGTPAAAEPPAGAITPGETPATPAPTPATPSVTSTTFTFTQGNIPGARENVPSDKFATQFVSDVSLNGTKFIGDSGAQVTAPSGLTDPDGHTVVKWMTEDGSDEMAPGETREINTLNGETFHAVWQPKDGNDDVQYRLVINANGGHFEGGIDVMNERHNFLPADMPNVKAATKMTRDGFTLAGFSHDKNGTIASARSLTEAMGIRDAEHIPGHTKDGALPGKTDEVYTLYAIWKDNSQVHTDEYRYVFMGNGGHVADDENVIHSTVVRGNDSDVAAISAPAMVRDGYTFIGWGASNTSTEAESLGVNSANFSTITADESVDGTTDVHVRRVYAIWKQNAPATQHKNTYVFDANGGTIAGSTDTTSTIANANPAEATNVAAPKAEKAGYTFVGWAKDPGASTTFVLGNDHVNFSSVGFTVENDTDGSVINVYKVYAVYKVATPDNPVTPPTPDNPVTPPTPDNPVNPVNPDTPGGHNGNITPGEPGGGTGTVTPDNPVTPGTDGDNYLGIPIHHTQGEPQYINTGNDGTTTQSDSAPQGHWVRKQVRRNALPNTGDAASATGIIAGIGAILASLGLSRKRKNQ